MVRGVPSFWVQQATVCTKDLRVHRFLSVVLLVSKHRFMQARRVFRHSSKDQKVPGYEHGYEDAPTRYRDMLE